MAYDGTIQGTPTFAAAKFSNGLTAVSDSNYVELPVGVCDFNSSASWTIEAWVQSSSAALKILFSTKPDTTIWLGSSAGGTFVFGPPAGGTGDFSAIVDSGIAICDASWHHVAAVMTAGTSLKLFVDGQLGVTATGTIPSLSPADMAEVGKLFGATGYAWPGAIDEIAIWNTAKYTGTFTPPTGAYAGSENDLRALYHLESDATDSTIPATVVASTPVIGEYGPTTVALSWAAATGDAPPFSYQVQRAPDSGGSPGTFANTGTSQSGLTFVDTGLSASTKYWWRVVATDDNAMSDTSSNVTITTLVADAKYNRLDGVVNSNNVLVLIPNTNAAIPYTGVAVPLFMFHHGWGGDELDMVSEPNVYDTRDACLDAGYICCAVGSGDNFGNQDGVDCYTDLYKFAYDRYSLSHTLVWSGSMGALCGLSSISQHKIPNIIAWAGINPVCSLANAYASPTFTSVIETAYSCNASTYAVKTFGHDPSLKWGRAFRNVYMRFYASNGDTTVPKADHTDVFQALIGTSSPESTIVLCTGGHGDPSHYQPADLVAFYERALADPPATTGLCGGDAPTAEEIAAAVRTELATELAHLDADVSTAGGGLTAQETRDALKLAPTAGSPAAGSVDAELDAIIASPGGLTAQETANAVHNLAPAGTPAANSVGAHLDTLIATTNAIKAITDALDVTAVTQVAASNAGHLTITVGLTCDEAVTGLTIPADWVSALWTLKNNPRDADTAAIVQLRTTNPAAGSDGLQRLNGAALVAPITAADGVLTVTQASGRIDVRLSDEMTALLGAATAIGWDVKFIDAGDDSTGRRGTADVVLTETKATA